MANVTESLFGITPEALQAQRDAALQEQAYKFAQLSPMQAAQAGFYTAGNRLGGAAAGLLGAEDPELQRIKQRQTMLQNIDISNPDSLKQGIQTAMQNKDYALVSELTGRYQASIKAALEGRKIESEIQKNLSEKMTPEMKNAQSKADMSGSPRGSEEWNKVFNATFDSLVAKSPHVDTVGVAMGTSQPVYMDKVSNEQFVIQNGKRIPYNGGVDRLTAKTNVSLSASADKSYGSSLGEGLAKDDLALKAGAVSAPDNLSTIEQTRQLLDSGKVYTGTGAGLKLSLTSLGKALGVTGQTDNEIIANTQQLQQNRAKAVLGQIKSSGLGTGQGFTDKDLVFLEKAAAGNITLDENTIRRQLQAEENALRALTSRWNTRVGELPADLQKSMGLRPVTLQNPVVPPAKSIPAGTGTATGVPLIDKYLK